MKYYILNNKIIKKATFEEWSKWFNVVNRTVKKTNIGNVLVSTVFLGIDHNFMGNGDPILFETMTFDGDVDILERCCTWEQALVQHDEVCVSIRGDNVVIFKAS